MPTTTRRISTVLLACLAMPLWAKPPCKPTHWYRMQTPHFDIIFRGSIEREAKRIANTLEHLYVPVSHTLGSQPPRIPIVLKNSLAEANGGIYPAGPHRGDFFAFPTQDYNLVGSNEWLSAVLATHEFRHAVQYAKLRQGLNKLAYYWGGEGAFAAITHWNVPAWFFEGDAVGTETALTQSGRGRIPYFLLRYKVNLLERGGFSYFKQTRGSYQDMLPSHYVVGYLMATHLRRKYGANAIADIFQETTRPRFFFTAVKNVTGRTVTQLYEDTNAELKALWEKQLVGLQITPAQPIHTRSSTEEYVDYRYPHLDATGNCLVYRHGMGTVGHFASIDQQQGVQHVFTPGMLTQGTSFSTAQHKLIWIEEVPHPRWETRSYSVIQCYDLETKRFKTLTPKGRYGAAALSPDATQVIAVESDEGYNHQLVLLDATNGQVRRRFPNPDNHFYLTPRWSANGQHIVAVKLAQRKASLILMDVRSGTSKVLCPPTTEHMGHPVMHGRYVFFNSAHSGIDNIYAVDTETLQRYQVTSRKYGAYNASPAADGQWLYFNDFSKNGMDVVKMPLSPETWIPWEAVEDKDIRYYAPLVAQEGNTLPLDNVPDHDYPIERYYPWGHTVSIHSWTPEIEPRGQAAQLILQSDDVLQTTEIQAGYHYNWKHQIGKLFSSIAYTKWYPIISLHGSVVSNYQEDTAQHSKIVGAAVGVPLQFRRGEYTCKLSGKIKGDAYFGEQKIWYTQTYAAAFRRASKSSTRDLYAPWSQRLSLSYLHTPFGGDVQGQRFFARIACGFPGFLKHHSLQLSTALQYKDQAALYNAAYIPRLMNTTKRTAHIELLQTLSAEYWFPVAYLDWSLGPICYFKRIHGVIFTNTTLIPNAPKDLMDYGREVGFGVFLEVCPPVVVPLSLLVGFSFIYNLDLGTCSYMPSFGSDFHRR